MKKPLKTKHMTAKLIILSFIVGAIVAFAAVMYPKLPENLISLILDVPTEAKIGLPLMVLLIAAAWILAVKQYRDESKQAAPVDSYKKKMIVQAKRASDPRKHGTVKPVNQKMVDKSKELLSEISRRS